LLGRTLGALGRHNEAIVQFDLAITTSPRDPLLELNYEAKAASLLALGEFSAAADWARRAASGRNSHTHT